MACRQLLTWSEQAMYSARIVKKGIPGAYVGAIWDVQVLFSGDHLAANAVGEWTTKHEDMGDGFLGISRSFNCELSASSLEGAIMSAHTPGALQMLCLRRPLRNAALRLSQGLFCDLIMIK